jgi:hypothetical protein
MNTILLIIFAVMILLILGIIVDKYSSKNEGFEIQENGCPSFTKRSTAIYGKNSRKTCCYGEVSNGVCKGDSCILGQAQDNLPECTMMIQSKRKEVADTLCPKAMPNVYFTPTHIGCTDGPLNGDESGPLHESAKKCTITIMPDGTMGENTCTDQIYLEKLSCFGSNCEKFIHTSPDKKRLIGMDFTASDGIRRSCFDNDSYKTYLQNSGMSAEKQEQILQFNPIVCNVAKKLYVDRTMEASSAILQ